MAVRAGAEPTTLRLKAIDSTKAPPCPINFNNICNYVNDVNTRLYGRVHTYEASGLMVGCGEGLLGVLESYDLQYQCAIGK